MNKFKFNTDHYFHIGSMHYSNGKPCQDYALSACNEQMACAIISDGCSTGGNTEFGSKILVQSTLIAIRDHAIATSGMVDPHHIAYLSVGARQQQVLITARLMLGLNRSDMLATCVYAYLTQFGGYAHVQGDGVVAQKLKDGTIRMHQYEWAENTPYYPSYADGNLENFIQAQGGDPHAKRLHYKTIVRHPDGKFQQYEDSLSLQDGVQGSIIVFDPEELENTEYIAVFSDGINQIDKVDWKDAVTTMLAFKSTAGEFAKRRMMTEIKSLLKHGKGPIDDISYSVIRIEHQKGEPLG